MHTPKKMLVINDLSCLGRCSMSVISPVVSAAGVQCCMLPTNLLSTHTDGFGEVKLFDVLDYAENALEHFLSLDVGFDMIYTGYLFGEKQVSFAERCISAFPAARVVIDPVMADNGSYYAGFDNGFASVMRRYCRHAEIITPNLTEAFYLAGLTPSKRVSEDELASLGNALLRETKVRRALITGVTLERGYCNALFDERGPQLLFHRRHLGEYPGTGDIFAAALSALLLREKPLEYSIYGAADVVLAAIDATEGTEKRLGVNIENVLWRMIQLAREGI